MEKIASFLLTSPSSPRMCRVTYAHAYTLSYHKFDRKPGNKQMLKFPNLEWLEKTKGFQSALENYILLPGV